MTVQPWINLEIDIENHVLHVKLMNGKSPIVSSANDEFDDNLIRAKRRLELLYPGNHELKMTTEQEMFIVFLNIELDHEAMIIFDEKEINPTEISNKKDPAIILKYASE